MQKGAFGIRSSGMRGVDAVSADTDHSFGRHFHDQFGIGIIQRGAQKSLSGRGTIEAEAGDIITVNPGEVHDGKPLDASGRAWHMLYFDIETLAEPILALTDGARSSAELQYPAFRNQLTAAHFKSLFRAITDPLGGQSEIEAREGLLLLLAPLLTIRQEAKTTAPKAIAKVRERMDDDPSAPVKLDELARIGGVSEFQLVRGFSKLTGMTPHAYLIQRRLHMSRKLIAAGTGLAEAALLAGFADQSHMTRLFVRAYGQSPGLYAVSRR